MPPDATLAPLDPDHQVAYLDGGDPDGVPVLGLHGTPGCRYSRWPDDAVYAAAGVRYVTLDRAGYGWSTRRRGRSVATEALSVLAVADHLGLESFAIVGEGAGGPHALACAALLSDRVTRVACRSSPAPVGTGGMQRRDWAAGRPGGDAELRWVAEGEVRVVRELQQQQELTSAALTADPERVRGETVTDEDRDFLRRPEVAERLRLIVREQGLQGVAGAVDDTLALARPWGFPLTAVAAPVLLTHHPADAAPVTHTRWLAARLRGAETSYDGGVDTEAEIAATMRWLAHG
ncbi:alpha/beta fold hydrolase [Nocardioides plantarum]|uniref:Alpha/beta fold hydrolase n=1 Tax=Nocardioides plantarum TaxID=29299 RepID=A0ABV5K6K8_9ACTN|nr:alpha/beta hydrolase [Nocardioides plantarum]